MLIVPPLPGFPFEDGQLLVDLEAGSYQVTFQLQAIPSGQEPFNNGVYNVSVALCDGGCGSSHKNARVMNVQNTSFTIHGH